MAKNHMAAMLDELMGRNRDLDPTVPSNQLNWDSAEVCKMYICGFCPYDLFTNTRVDMGACDKLHVLDLREKYQKSSRYEKMGYEEDMARYLQTLLADVDLRIKRGHKRLALNNMPIVVEVRKAADGGTYRVLTCGTDGQDGEILDPEARERLDALTERINNLVEEAETMGNEGKVEEAQECMKKCEQLKGERADLEVEFSRRSTYDKNKGFNDDKKMELCDCCGAMVAGDSQLRINEHISGKQHRGYALMRQYCEDIRNKRMKPIEERERKKEEERAVREAEKEKERAERRAKDAEKEREREERRKKEEEERDKRRKEREEKLRKEMLEGKRRSRSRSRSREKKRSRDRSRDRGSGKDRRRSRSRDAARRGDGGRRDDERERGSGGSSRRSRSR